MLYRPTCFYSAVFTTALNVCAWSVCCGLANTLHSTTVFTACLQMTLWTACDCIGGNKAATILHVSVSTIPKALQILSVSLQHLPAGCPGQTATYAALTWCRDMQSPSYLNYKAVAHLHSRSSIVPKEVLCLQEGRNGSSAPGQGRNHRLLA